MYYFLLYSKLNQLYVNIYPLSLEHLSHTPSHPTHPVHHRALNWAPCRIQTVPTSYLFYLWAVRIRPSQPPESSPTTSPFSVSTQPFSKSVSLFLLFKKQNKTFFPMTCSVQLLPLCESVPHSFPDTAPLHSKKILLPGLCSCNTLTMSQMVVLIFCNCLTFLWSALIGLEFCPVQFASSVPTYHSGKYTASVQ